MRRVLNYAGGLVLLTVVTPVLSACVLLGTLVFVPLPATLPAPRQGFEARATHVLDSAGNEIALWRQFETSIPVAQADVPKVLKDAVVAAEDRGFYDHGGIDVGATVRALWANVQSGSVVQGGSTITQQYVKNAFTTGDRTLSRKIHEAILASQLDRQMGKDEILFKYLSTIYFGGGAYGVGAAADTFFHKAVKDLTLSESALLAGVIPSPSRYDPRVAPGLAEQRRVLVLNEMLDQGRIDAATHYAALAQHLWLAAAGDAPPVATVVYPPQQQVSIQPWFTDYVRSWLESHLPGCQTDQVCPALDKGGLRVETTLDPTAQAAAQEEVSKVVDGEDPDVQMALVSVEPPTGYVKAMVGGRDYYGQSQFNTATSGHQPGSSFKPFVLATAFASGIPPTKVYSGAPCKTPDGGVINNYGGASYGSLDLRHATWSSVNGVYCRLILDPAVGVDQVMAMTARLGIPTPAFDPSKYGASVGLGVLDVSPLNMASAFGVFADHGKHAQPTPVLRVLDADGKVLIDNTASVDHAPQVISDTVADNVTDVLRGVLTDGTAHGKGIDRPAAGKTGTAEDAANAWFVGYTPTLSTAVWLGHLSCGASSPDRDCGLRNIGGVRGEITGGTVPAATWQRYMKRALDGVPVTEFAEPAPIQTFADKAKRNARQGYDLLPRRYPAGGPRADGFIEDAPAPIASAPTTSTTTSTTSTTSPSPITQPPAPPPTLFPN
ncbi:MAG: penicillin-binding protein [Acidimicrobiaceae bacterium]